MDVFVETFQPEKYPISVQKFYIKTHQGDPLEKQGKNTWGMISNKSSQQIIFFRISAYSRLFNQGICPMCSHGGSVC